jgi:hypothetical protein
MNRKPIIFLIARDYQQARVAAKRMGLTRNEWTFLDRRERIMALERFVVVRCGQAPDSRELIEADLLVNEYEKLGRCTVLYALEP